MKTFKGFECTPDNFKSFVLSEGEKPEISTYLARMEDNYPDLSTEELANRIKQSCGTCFIPDSLIESDANVIDEYDFVEYGFGKEKDIAELVSEICSSVNEHIRKQVDIVVEKICEEDGQEAAESARSMFHLYARKGHVIFPNPASIDESFHRIAESAEGFGGFYQDSVIFVDTNELKERFMSQSYTNFFEENGYIVAGNTITASSEDLLAQENTNQAPSVNC